VWDFWTLVAETGVVIQQLSTILLFVSVFIHVHQHKLEATVLLVGLATTTVMGMIVWNSVQQQQWRLQLTSVGPWRTSLLLLLIIMGLTPILRSLTVNTSSDSIWAIATCLLLTNFVLHDYSTASSQRMM